MEERYGGMKKVSFLATLFGVIGWIPFIIFWLIWTFYVGIVPNYAIPTLLGGTIACWILSTSSFLAWGILRSLCEIYKITTFIEEEPRYRHE